MPLRNLSLDDLIIDDEASFRHVALYGQLKEVLRRARHRFQVPAAGSQTSWDRVLFLNLTYWSAGEEASVLCDEHIAPDVIAHTAWHHLAAKALAASGGDTDAAAPTAASLMFCESIASAFDLYLVGRLIDNAPTSDFITTQVPIMAEAAEQAGLPETGFAELLHSTSADPERAFEDMRALLMDVGAALTACRDAGAAQTALEGFVGRRFEPLIHHFQFSNWILYARAYAAVSAAGAAAADRAVAELDRTLRDAPVSLDWLAKEWLSPGPPAPSGGKT
jgi:hypothetical protein